MVAVKANLPSRFMSRINGSRYLATIQSHGKSEAVEQDLFVLITLLRHLMAGSVELKVFARYSYTTLANMRQASST